MNYKKIDKTIKVTSKPTVDDLKMVKVTLTYPVAKKADYGNILSELEGMTYYELEDLGNIEVEESAVSLNEIKDWFKKTGIKPSEWEIPFMDDYVTVDEMIKNTKGKK